MTNALKNGKILKKEIEIKYNILSVEYPESFIDTEFEVKLNQLLKGQIDIKIKNTFYLKIFK